MKRAFLQAIALALSPVSAAAAPLDDRLSALAMQGNAEAAYHLGMLYNNGIGVPPDPERALHWFRFAAEKGDALGAYKLGCYYDGQGERVIAADPAAALRYKLIAAEAGYSLAQDDVATHYLASGDRAMMVRWLEAAAAQGDLTGLLRIVMLDGRAPEVSDAVRAYVALGELVTLAGHDAPPEMKTELNRIGARLLVSVRKEADRRIAAYAPVPTALTLKAREGLEAARRLVGID